MNNFFRSVTAFVNGIEDNAINMVSAFVPWMVPIIPAYLTYIHNVNELKFPVWVSWTAAFVVEFLGLASMRTSIKFYEHNKRYTVEYKRAPFVLVLLTYVFYIVVVLSVNVVLDWGSLAGSHIWAIALFSLLSVPSGILISVRAQHTELEQKIEADKQERKQGSKPKKAPEAEVKIYASSKRQEIVELLDLIYRTDGRIAGPTELANRFELDPDTSKGYISGLIKAWKSERNIQ